MPRLLSSVVAALVVLLAPIAGVAQITPEMLARGKKATAFLEITHDEGLVLGSAFCIDKSGLFITNAHAVEKAATKGSTVRLVLDIGYETQRVLRARVFRKDDESNLALLQVEGATGLTALELGRDADLTEQVEVVTFGYPFGHMLSVGAGNYPDITVTPRRISSLPKAEGRFVSIGFDRDISPGNSGGPVMDGSGKVVGVAVAKLPDPAPPDAVARWSVPVGRLSEFLTMPGLVFDPPPIRWYGESVRKPVTWTIQVQPGMPGATRIEPLEISVEVTSHGFRPHRYAAEPAGGGTFRATFVPFVETRLTVRDGATGKDQFSAVVPDHEVGVGAEKFPVSDLDWIRGGKTPRVRTLKGREVPGKVEGLGSVIRRYGGGNPETIDLDQEIELRVSQELDFIGSPSSRVEAVAEARQGSRVVLRTRRHLDVISHDPVVK